MSFPDKDRQILAHILEYCVRIEKTVTRFGQDFDTFLSDQDYMDSVSMNLLQIGELSGKFRCICAKYPIQHELACHQKYAKPVRP